MSDMTTIMPEERAEIRHIAVRTGALPGKASIYKKLAQLLDAIEQTESSAEKAEAEVAGLRDALQTAEIALSLAHHRGQYDLVDKALSKVCTALYGNKNADEEAARRAVAAGDKGNE